MPSLLDWLVDNEPSFRKSRLPSLYSDLNVQKQTNPEGYAANVQAWQSALTRAALAEQLPTEQLFILQTSDALVTALASSQYGRPSGLGAVIDDSIREGKMIDIRNFTEAEKSKLRSGSLVLVPALEDIGKRIESWWQGKPHSSNGLADRIISREEFAKQLPSILQASHALAPQDIDTLLCYLSRDRQLLSHNANAIKFKAPSATTIQPDPVTAEDSSIANLKQLISSLSAQCATLESTISTQQSRAASFVSQKNKTSALGALRSKKRAEEALAQRTATLQQLEDVYHSIEQAADHISIVETLQSSATTLKALNKKVGSVDRVEDIIYELRQQIGKADEVSVVLQEPLREDDVVGEVEIDDELAAMEREEQVGQDKRLADETERRLHAAGQVPQILPDKTNDAVESELAKRVEKMDAPHLADPY
ncbi:hypothetical protein DV736_g255, partial [Chaetothyriales sp. CBS 134916]